MFPAAYLDPPIVPPDDFLNDPKPEPRANILFCREEWFEDTLEVIHPDTAAVIGDC